MTYMTPLQTQKPSCVTVLIHGLRIKVQFSTEQNAEAPQLVREILKYGYLLRQNR